MMNEKKRLSSKTWVKRLLSFVLALAMMVTIVPTSGLATAKAAETDTVVYLKPNSNWTQANARFAAYFFGNGEKWVGMTDSDNDGYYEVTVPAGYPNVIFCRMNPGATANNWNNKWNQTADLTVPTGTNNCYTVRENTWDQGGGTWSKYYVEYTVSFQGENVISNGASKATQENAYAATLTAADGYDLPETISVTSGGVEVEHAYNKDTGELTIAADKITGDITITAVGVEQVEVPTRITVYFRNDWNWTDIRVHFWGSSVEGDTSWPGKEVTFVEKGNDGKDVYSCVIPADVTGIIFNGIKDDGSGNRDQSPNIETGIADGNAYYMHWNNGNQCSTYNYTPPAKEYVITFVGTNVTSNGAAVAVEGESYTATLTAADGYDLPETILVQSGEADVEHTYDQATGELTIAADKISGDIKITAVGVERVEVPTHITVYFRNDWNWTDIRVHYWGSSAEGDTSWPGKGMTFVETGDDGNDVYSCVVPADVSGIIFNGIKDDGSGNRDQSPNIETGIADGNAYYMHWNNGNQCSTYNYTPPAKEYVITFVGTNVTSNGAAVAVEGESYTATLAAADGYDLPETILVQSDEADVEHTYDKTTGELTIKAEDITGDITITAAGVEQAPTHITVYFRNDWKWTDIRVHFWGSSVEGDTSWPGKGMTFVETGDDGNDVYSCVVPADVTGIIFNGIKDDGSGNRDQSPNIETGIADGNAYYMHWDGENKCSTYSYTPPTGGGEGDEGDEPAPKSTYTVIFHFANTIGWSPLNLYVWNNDGATTGSWPGAAITKQDENGYHTMTVTYEVSTNAGLNYIFNNGSSQTKDLSVAASEFDETTKTAELWVELDATPVKEGENDRYVIKQVSDQPFDDVALAVSPQINGTSVTFEYVNASASSVEVRGTIPGASWSQGIAMSKNAKGLWTVTVEVEDPAVYQYKFVINGETWVADPANGKTDSDGNSVFTITDPDAEDTNTVNINVFYERGDDVFVVENADGADTGIWNAYVWGDGVKAGRWDFATDVNDLNGNGNTDEMVTTITVKGRECQNVYLKPRMSTENKEWLQEESQVNIAVGNILSGTINVYVVSDGTNGNKGNMSYSAVTGTDIVVGNKIIDVQYDYDNNKINVTTLEALEDTAELKWVTPANSTVAVDGISSSGLTYTLSLNETMDLVDLYQYKIAYDGYEYEIGIDTVYASDKFAADYTYTDIDKELGAAWSEASTTFKVWAPTAENVSVNLYVSGTKGTDDLIKSVPMTRGAKGIWTVTVDGDLNGTYYTYSVKVNGETIESVDPYARTTGVNGNRGMVIDLSKTEPEDGWTELTDKPANYTDAVIYELHVRDFSIDDSSGVKDAWKGKFLGLTQTGTKTAGGKTTGLDYLKELGITHLHLLPIYDYASVKEDKLDVAQFNWGYDPQNYNVPEGSYSTDPYDGATRVKEMKEMVDTLHENGIGVIMDVVYNHVYDADTFSMNLIVPGYFSRVDSNRSGCGNDTASEREMVRKFIVESVLYWAEEYHIDGFRFDLVGLIDVETINQIVTEVHKHREDIIFYGEGWDMDDTNREPGTEMAKQGNASKTPGFGYFSDSMRNLLGGNNGHSLGFVSGQSGQEGALVSNYKGNPGWTSNPEQVVQYASCHDNYTLIDKILISTGKSKLNSEIAKMSNLAAVVYMTSQGVPFIHAGEEMLREKIEEDGGRCENSYNASDFVNHIEWSNLEREEYANNSEYYKGLIEFRKAHPALRMTDSSKIEQSIQVKNAADNLVIFAIDGSVSGDEDDIYVIFNANASLKSVNLPNGEWTININDSKAGTESLGTVSGSVDVAGISAMVLTKKDTGADGSDPVDPNATITLYFSNNKYWNNVYAYAFDNDQPVGNAWPGAEMIYVETNDYGEKIYSVTVPASIDGIVFHNNSGEQTVDIVPGADGTGYYCTDKNGENKYEYGTYSYSGAPAGDSNSYYLVGYINSNDYTGTSYKLDAEGKITVTFNTSSYVYVVNGDQSETYMTQGWLGGVTSATLYEINKNSLTADKWDKMMIPGGMEVTITMAKNNNNTVTLSYEAKIEPGVEDQSGIQDGVTLHAWNWSFTEIEKNMAAIADMGFTAIQTSPVQPIKESTKDAGDNVGEHWWLYYQPVDFVITDQKGNALGTKADLKSMIETAHKYGIQVIVDVVANHLANQNRNDLSDKIPEYLLKDEYWHDIKVNISNWNDRDDMTQNCMDGLPDLNTANKEIQQYVLAFLKECVDIGVDGFRFDAAKSIETPDDDPWFDSDFWPTVIGGAETYAQAQYGKNLYMYGEILDDPCIQLSAYTKYMSITDNSWGNALRNNVAAGSASVNAGYNKAANASNLVIWAESHDTYMTSDSNQSSYNVSEANINKTWALVAARADAMGLYFARPKSVDQKLGVASSTGWDNVEVQAVNRFHNFFAGKGESVSNEGKISYVERGDLGRSTDAMYGVVLVNVAGDAVEVEVTANRMTDGTYYDQLTSNVFTVENGKIKGKIGDSGIAVVYSAPIDYKIVEGANASWTKGSDASLTFRATGKINDVEVYGRVDKVYINGTPIDAKNYIVKDGYTVIFEVEFLESLTKGKKELKFAFEANGKTYYTEEVNFTIKQKSSGQETPAPQPNEPQQPNQSTNAPTGDNSPILLYSMLALGALAVMAEAERRRRRA